MAAWFRIVIYLRDWFLKKNIRKIEYWSFYSLGVASRIRFEASI
jgi:hypothetical protein